MEVESHMALGIFFPSFFFFSFTFEPLLTRLTSMDVQDIREKGRDTAPPIEREKLLASLISIALGFLKGYKRGSFTS